MDTMTTANRFLQTLSTIVLVATIVAVPTLLLPFTSNFIYESKFYIFLLGTLLFGVLFAAQSFKRGAIEFILSPLTWPLVVFAGAVLASTFFANTYPVESLLGLGGVYLISVLFVLLGGSTLSQSATKLILPSAAIAGSLLSVFAVAELIGYGPSQVVAAVLGFPMDATIAFSVTGNTLFSLQFIALALLGLVLYVVKSKHVSKLTAITVPILIIGLAIHIWAILPGRPAAASLPNWTASWSVALDTIRTPRQALIGAGPESYSNMYSRFKPAWVNQTEFWTVTFAQASNVPLTMLTTMGFLGLVGWFALAWASVRMLKYTSTPETKALAGVLVATFAIQLLLPTNFILIFVQAVAMLGLLVGERHRCSTLMFQALAMQITRKKNDFDQQPDAKSVSLPVSLSAGILLLGIFAVGFLSTQAYRASAASLAAAKAMEGDDAGLVYDLQAQAKNLNPFLDIYRREFASTNILIAIANADQTELAADQQEIISTLLQQAIREAQAATVLDPLDVQNWLVLAQIYQNLIGAVEEAEQFALSAYIEAINADPTNPSHRINLGGIFLGQENFQQAYALFDQAVSLKPDLPISYYNRAFALTKLEAYIEARRDYQMVLSLLGRTQEGLDSEDYKQVQGELAEIEKLIPPEALAEADGLTQPGEGEEQQPAIQTESNPILDQNLQDPARSVPPQEDAQLPAGTGTQRTPAGEAAEPIDEAEPEAAE